MACLTNNYNPNPTRLWNRTQNCTALISKLDDGTLYIPYFKKNIPVEKVETALRMLYKGNILKNPPNIKNNGVTKKTNYSKTIQGFGQNRKRAWGSQTASVSIPNVNNLQRINYSIISNNPNGEIQFPECTQSTKKNAQFPFITPPTTSNLPDISKPIGSTPYNFIITEIITNLNDSIIEGGILIPCSQENICNGNVTSIDKIISCFPTSASDVPGKVVNLCYPTNAPTYFPRVRRTYTDNSTKWPNSKFSFNAAENVK
jgi:hypothetical protein